LTFDHCSEISVTPERDGDPDIRSPMFGAAGRMRLVAEAGRTYAWKDPHPRT
jgi:hypothetical protein